MRFIRMHGAFQLLLLIVGITCVFPSWADKTNGIFSAQQSCPAYVSKNKLTNPGHAELKVGEHYQTIEVNRPDHPSWYRIVVPNAYPKERWVSADCGQFQAEEGAGTEAEAGSKACNTAGRADSYILALSWQPAFCEIKPQKPECRITDSSSYQARHFTLHGLWPNQQPCGEHYEFCGEVRAKKERFCDYPAIKLDSDSQTALAEVMPSVRVGSCLERHEWHKHGTCQTIWSLEEYFDLSVDLTRQFNEAGMAYFMNRKIGQQVRTEDFLNRLAAVLGPAARERVKLNCERGMLVEVQISLVADLTPGKDLEQLIAQAPKQTSSSCQETFFVDTIGFNNE
ncbi:MULTISPECIES: ribonuclease T2 family protein [Nitrosomonas]|uniref:Ribonuclease T n=1 Tax=Nitrosomonas communis TaxID=44574 RepID=A0A0F7KBR0_9PROT|nr:MULTISPECIES: ribonuclease T [Nitrosomonas]AKH37041.1 ribonuclease T [Nitrosomonas communis]TYP93272.1 ribonuclease T2 [Nitrosomonas communis]UVS62189.1 ribonuclease T [Nitrosomonas sp. PLL12]